MVIVVIAVAILKVIFKCFAVTGTTRRCVVFSFMLLLFNVTAVRKLSALRALHPSASHPLGDA